MSLYELKYSFICPFLEKFCGPFSRTKASSRAEYDTVGDWQQCTTHLYTLHTEKPREIPVLARCEVLVVGGGPSGLSAALGARRAGADVILCERFGCFGGVITTVGMETIGWYR